jgi:hypothetical protein
VTVDAGSAGAGTGQAVAQQGVARPQQVRGRLAAGILGTGRDLADGGSERRVRLTGPGQLGDRGVHGPVHRRVHGGVQRPLRRPGHGVRGFRRRCGPGERVDLWGAVQVARVRPGEDDLLAHLVGELGQAEGRVAPSVDRHQRRVRRQGPQRLGAVVRGRRVEEVVEDEDGPRRQRREGASVGVAVAARPDPHW